MKTTKEQVLKIPALKKRGMTDEEVAVKLGMAPRTLSYWKNRLRNEGYTFPNAKRKPMDLKE